MLGGKQLGKVVEFALHQLEEFEEKAREALRVGRRPSWLCSLRIGDRVLDLGVLGQSNPRLHGAGIGIEDVTKPSRGAFDGLAADEMADLTHGSSPWVLAVIFGLLPTFSVIFAASSGRQHMRAAIWRLFLH